MIEQKVLKERAILVGVLLNDKETHNLDEHLDELEMLALTAGAIVVGRVVQRIVKINPSTFIGTGKANQLINQATELDVKIIIFDQELSPAQVKNYHKIANKIKVIDRSGLILDIFKKRAKSKEASTQVELAYLEYLLPRLTRQWTHLERQMGGIGTRAGMGETQIEVDRRIIRTKISKLKTKLKRIEKERTLQGINRKNEFRVALVGYTNAGKSTLFNTMSRSDVYVKNQLFATLDTTVRKVKLDNFHKILLSDTVGFIRKLPHNLVASFRSTLKEVLEADLILTVLDISNHQIMDHLETIQKVLEELGAENIKNIIVLNKFDLIVDNILLEKINIKLPNSVMISAKEHLMLTKLKSRIIEVMEENYVTMDIEILYNQGKKLSYAQRNFLILERFYNEENIVLKIRGKKDRLQKIISIKN